MPLSRHDTRGKERPEGHRTTHRALLLARLGFAGFLTTAITVHAGLKTWNGTGDWHADVGNWTGGLPVDGDVVVIATGSLTLTNASPDLAAFTNHVTLTFVGTNTVLQATNVVVNGTLTHLAQTATGTNSAGQWVPDHRVAIRCGTLTVNAGKAINVDKKGYQGVVNSTGRGPGGAAANYGGGYGGQGGGAGGGATYGSPVEPEDPGSAGGGAPNDGGKRGGHGGGAVRINATGIVRIDGSLSAQGEPGSDVSMWVGGGSGGAVTIGCSALAGTGSINVNGGTANSGGRGGGGGGRIAIDYDQGDQLAAGAPGVKFHASPGVPTVSAMGYPGTIYVPDTTFFPTTALYGGEIVIPGFTSWNPAVLSVSEGPLRFPAPFTLTVDGSIACSNGGGLQLASVAGTGSVIHGGAGFTLTGGRIDLTGAGTNKVELRVAGDLAVASSLIQLHTDNNTATPAAAELYGAEIRVDGDIAMASNSTVIFDSHGTLGGSSFIRSRNFTLDSGCSLNADNNGYGGQKNSTGIGPGAGGYAGGGGGHGGKGGNATTGGNPYGVTNTPVQPGSSGGGAPNNGGTTGGGGGGAVRLETEKMLRIDGVITANGGLGDAFAGGGSGGSIYLRCHRFSGTNGVIRANGGAAGISGGGGAGGRIAILRSIHSYTGSAPTVTGGTGTGGNGANGTAVWLDGPKGTVFVIF